MMSCELPPPTPYEEERLEHTLNSKIYEWKRLVGDLEAAVSVLPNVSPDGVSECPFADELYAKKEKLQNQVLFQLNNIQHDLALVNKEIDRLQRNLSALAECANGLYNQDPKDKIVFGEKDCQEKLDKALRQKSALLELIELLNNVLDKSRFKQYPGKKGWVPMPGRGAQAIGNSTQLDSIQDHKYGCPSTPPPIPEQIRRETRREVNDLISLGPQKGKAGI